MLSPAAITGGVNYARINGVTLTPAEVSKALRVRAVPSSQLVEIAVVHDTREVAAAITAGVMNSYVTADPTAAIVGGPGIPTREHFQPLFILGGVIAGLLGGWVVVTLRKR